VQFSDTALRKPCHTDLYCLRLARLVSLFCPTQNALTTPRNKPAVAGFVLSLVLFYQAFSIIITVYAVRIPRITPQINERTQ
jgi:hypothetical protein